jgi:hypothetical protein
MSGQPDADTMRAAVSALANALQAAIPAAARLHQRLDEQATDADVLEAALHRAAEAIRQLRPDNGAAR